MRAVFASSAIGSEAELSDREQGTIKFFNSDKGYGFVSRDGLPDVFLHASALPSGADVGEGDRVSFEIQDTPRGKKAAAVQLEELEG